MLLDFLNGKCLDDIDPEQLSDEQKQALTDMYDKNPYYFYSLWRDPDAIQRRIEGDDFTTTPAREYIRQVGALTLAGAPESVQNYWANHLETKNRPSADTSLYPPKMKPVQAKLDQIEELCRYLHELLNRTDTYTYNPDEPDWPDDVPWASKWLAVLRTARRQPAVVQHHGSVRHYKDTDMTGAFMGCELVEIILSEFPAEFDLDEIADRFIHPSGADIDVIETGVRIKLEFYDVYE